jgi:hypothetical protein
LCSFFEDERHHRHAYRVTDAQQMANAARIEGHFVDYSSSPKEPLKSTPKRSSFPFISLTSGHIV